MLISSACFNCLSLELDGAGYYEVRVLHPDPDPNDVATRAKSRWFPTTVSGLNAATDYAADSNRDGFNAYVTPNPLVTNAPRDGHRTAIDEDVACGVLNVLDADSTDERELAVNLASGGFPPPTQRAGRHRRSCPDRAGESES